MGVVLLRGMFYNGGHLIIWGRCFCHGGGEGVYVCITTLKHFLLFKASCSRFLNKKSQTLPHHFHLTGVQVKARTLNCFRSNGSDQKTYHYRVVSLWNELQPCSFKNQQVSDRFSTVAKGGFFISPLTLELVSLHYESSLIKPRVRVKHQCVFYEKPPPSRCRDWI